VLLLLCFPEVFFANFWPRYAAQRPGYLSQHVHSTFFLPPSGLPPHAPNVQRQGKPGVSSFCPYMFCPYSMRGYSVLQSEVYNALPRVNYIVTL